MGIDEVSTAEPGISVVMCTLNREGLLDEALATLAVQQDPGVDWELVIVDNGSTDGTPQIIASWQAKMSNLRYVREERRGHTIARNRGLAEARALVVAFTDDDVFVADSWVSEIARSTAEHPEAGGFGGRVVLRTGDALPSWLGDTWITYLATCEFGDDEKVLALPDYPVGANMWFRRAPLEAMGGFVESLGHKGAMPMGCDEAAVFARLSEAGESVVYVPTAIIEHRVDSDRLTQRWMAKRMFAEGLGRVKLESAIGPSLGHHSLRDSLVNGLARRKKRAVTQLFRGDPSYLRDEAFLMCFHAGILLGLSSRRAKSTHAPLASTPELSGSRTGQ